MTQKTAVLAATMRADFGKGPVHRLRREGFVPAVVCEKGKPTMAISINSQQATRALQGPTGRNVLIELHVQQQQGGAVEETRTVMVQELQLHPVQRSLRHVDFIEVNPGKELSISVPIKLVGRSKQVIGGAKLRQLQRHLSISCLPKDVPVHVSLDITELPVGKTPAQALQLPKSVRLSCDPHLHVLNIVAGGRDQSGDEESPKATS